MSNQSNQQNAAFFIKDINILQSFNAVELSNKIRSAIADGWVVHGDLIINPSDGTLIQQVVKYDQRLVDLTEATMAMVAEQLKQFR